jgi:hypothetical protein
MNDKVRAWTANAFANITARRQLKNHHSTDDAIQLREGLARIQELNAAGQTYAVILAKWKISMKL